MISCSIFSLQQMPHWIPVANCTVKASENRFLEDAKYLMKIPDEDYHVFHAAFPHVDIESFQEFTKSRTADLRYIR